MNRIVCQIVTLSAVCFATMAQQARAVTWFPFGPNGGDARAFAGDPKDPNHIYLGTTNGWIYQTHDGGRHWARLASLGKRDDLVLDNIAIDPVNPRHIVVGAWKAADLHHPDGGIYISDDAGQTWTMDKDMQGQSVLALAVAPSDPKIMVAGSMDGVFRSDDSGQHWQQISPKGSAEIHEVESIAIDPANPQTIYAGTWHLPWKTTDGGAKWQNMNQGLIEDSDIFSIIVDKKQPSTMYLSACSGIYKSVDAGVNFVGGVGKNKAQGIPSSARRTRVLMQDPNNASTVFAGTTEGLYRTDDAGKYWMQTTGSDVIVNDVYVDPSNSKRVLLATDRGGVLASDDGGTSFRDANDGFSARQVVAYAADANHPATVYVGVVNDKQWGGAFVSRNGGLSWSQISAGLDGRDVLSLTQAPSGDILAGTSHGIFRWGGAIWQHIPAEIVSEPVPARRSERSSSHASHAHVAEVRLSARTKPFDGMVYGFVTSGDTMFAATSQGLLSSSTGDKAWKSLLSIPQDEYRFLASEQAKVAAASLDALELSSDGGRSWKSAPLPKGATQLTAVAIDGQGTVWLGTREGAFYSTDGGANWQTLKALYLRNPDCIYYDAANHRVLVTSASPGSAAFAVELPSLKVTWWDTGWNLRFIRPIGDHMIAATLYDGIVLQPRMVASPLANPAATTGAATTAQR